MVGHEKQWNNLKKAWKLGRLSHALLLSGRDSLGKKKFALEFIKLINCQDSNSNQKPCGECESCRMIERGSFNDFLSVAPESKFGSEGSIRISQIRKLQKFLSYRASIGKFKTAIIDEAEKMTNSAQGSLLKTLEEPSGKTFLFLVSSKPDVLLSTIYSRCEVIKFFQVKRNKIKDYLISQGASREKASVLSSMSEGRPGRALRLLSNPEQAAKEKKITKDILKMYNSDFGWQFNYIKKIASKKSSIDLEQFFEVLQRTLRNILIKKAGMKNNLSFEVKLPLDNKLSKMSLIDLKNHIQQVEKIRNLTVSTNVNSRLVLETLMTTI